MRAPSEETLRLGWGEGRAGFTAQHGPRERTARALLTYSAVSSISHCARWEKRGQVSRRRGPAGPPTNPVPRRTHLRVGQHHVLDTGRPAGLGAIHAHVVDLVTTNLAMLPAGRGRAPQHADGRGVERLRLHLPRRRAGHWRTGGEGRQGRYRDARLCPPGPAGLGVAAAGARGMRTALPTGPAGDPLHWSEPLARGS